MDPKPSRTWITLQNLALAAAIGILVGFLLGGLADLGIVLPGGPTIGVGLAMGISFVLLQSRRQRR